MIKINLLPYREREKRESLTKQVVKVVVPLIAIFLVVGSVHLYFWLKIVAIQKEVRELENKMVSLNKIIGDIEKFKKDKAVFEKKLAIINNLEANRFAPIRMLDELTSLVPVKDIWLEKLTEKGPEVIIEGVARNNIAVALFMKNLAGSQLVRSVDLISTKEREIAGVKLQQFVVSCVMKKGI